MAGKTLKIYPKNYKGDKGDPVELRVTATDIEWRWVNWPYWTHLITLAELQGPAGPRGITISATPPANPQTGDIWIDIS